MTTLKPSATRAISFGWGMAEAVFFFFVPDIWLGYLALKSFKEALINLVFALAGALTGGLLVYAAGMYWFDDTTRLLDFVPAISAGMISAAGSEIKMGGFLTALFSGSAAGVPYKIFGVWAGHLAVPLALFAFASIVARAARFLLVTVFIYLVGKGLSRYLSLKKLQLVHAGCWVIFYAIYFWCMG